ncbi:hypothetical protein BCF33_2808 [Hasllibacter halocynthiae]|uniref:Chromosome partitioning protein ParB n=1 Tax=Hasllibacter halocynthiae TaxID=595589 RepID=A0A2T0WYZ5_9RHOB|nr:chromosome partitioning protein ParB [Hasllibacter halocynthiae]PRY91926.1 hypothetical protein BCF33_2808 [Hasllibacter halocynthiae]
MSEPFRIDAGALRARPKAAGEAELRAADRAGEAQGFLAREPRRGGRRPSPRTGQVHAKVLPHVRDEILEEAARRGVTQGVLIEEAWALYLARQEQERRPGAGGPDRPGS